ncbi:MAG: MFS transporter [Chloroflexi bacterium]|nr:MFS transporter [Chloroflexota bacterium]
MPISQPEVATDSRQFAANIPRYFLYTVFKGFSFGLITATWVIYLQQQRGFSLTQATLIDVAFWMAAAFGEIPTGVVADTAGRKISMAIGAAIMSLSIFAWVFAPTLPLIMLAYIGLAIGATFLTGAEDALFYESLQITGRAEEYTRLVGRVSATTLGAIAIGSVASGLFATINLKAPFLVAGLSYLIMLSIILTLKEPQHKESSAGQIRKSYREILRQSLALMRARPTLLYPMLYLSLVPLIAVIMETVFVQPQAMALGVPLAGVGIIVMVLQLTNMAGATASHRFITRVGAAQILYAAPVIIIASLLLLAVLQIFPALLFIAAISFVTAILRPLVLTRIQNELSNDIRATILSMQSLMLTLLAATIEPLLGLIADRAGLPAAYVALAGILGILILWLFWKSGPHFPRSTPSKPSTS